MSAGKGWIGEPEQLLHVLHTVGADRDEKGSFLVFGEPVISGLTGDVVVPAGAECSIRGRRVNIAALLADTSYGTKVTVIA